MIGTLQTQNDPAATAIAPGQVLNNPSKESSMNIHTNTTPGFTTPVCCLTVDQIHKMTMRERRGYYDALLLTESTLGALTCQPRFENSRTGSLNAAGDLLDALHGFVLECMDMLIKVTTADTPTNAEEAEHRAWILLRYAVDCGDSLPDLVAIASKEAAAVPCMGLGNHLQEARA